MKFFGNGSALLGVFILTALALIIFPPSALARGIIYGPETFVRSTGKPVVVSEELSSTRERQAILRVMNGGSGTPVAKRLSSAWIRLNGVEVVNESNFSHTTPIVEVPVTVYEGANSLDVQVTSVPGGMITVEIVSNEPFEEPTVEVFDAAQLIHEEIPGARLTFSQLHGHLMLVQTPGLIDPEDPGLPEPLAYARGLDEDAFASAMIDYLVRFRTAYMMKDPALEMQIPVDPVNEIFNGIARDPNDPFGVSTLRLVHTYRGLRISGRYAIGSFDPDGNLQSMLTRILPVSGEFDPKPAFSEAGALAAIEFAFESIILNETDLEWLRSGLGSAESVAELLWIPAGTGADSPLRLAYEVQLRSNIHTARIQVDARSGAIIRALNTTPSEWYDDGTPGTVDVKDETGVTQSIVTTLDGDTWYMGFGAPYSDPGLSPYFNAGAFLAISDTAGRADLRLLYQEAMSIDAAEGTNTWATDPTYTGNTRAATSLMKNLRRALGWWHSSYSWRSWDGRGSTLWTSINTNKTPGSPDFNAWGGGGGIQIGDGTTAAGETLAMSLETVGHEFMHNVISATSRLVYADESGALNESLADFFGAALTATGADRFNNAQFGELPSGSGSVRNMQNPRISRYTNYLVTTNDAGGVHTNSGILNKAHWLVVMGGAFNGLSVDPIGVSRVAEMLKAANQFRLYSPDTTMEEYAASIVGYCDLVSLFVRAFGGTPDTAICTSLTRAYRATLLLRAAAGGIDISLDRAFVGAKAPQENLNKAVAFEITNLSLVDVFARDTLQLQVTDEIGGITALANRGFFGDRISKTDISVHCHHYLDNFLIGPEDTRCGLVDMPVGILDGYMTGIRRFTLEAVVMPPYADLNTRDNRIKLSVGSDYRPLRAFFMPATWDGIEIRGLTNNQTGGFPAGLKGVYLTRSTAHGPLFEIGPAAEDTLETTIALGKTGSRVFRIGGDLFFPTGWIPSIDPKIPPVVELIELPTATRVPGTANTYEIGFDSEGGLAELEGRGQYYMLADSRDMATELDETNNLMCVNCVAPGQDTGFEEYGVIIRLPLDTPVESLFPPQYLDAARKLKTDYRSIYDVLRRFEPSFDYRYEPGFP